MKYQKYILFTLLLCLITLNLNQYSANNFTVYAQENNSNENNKIDEHPELIKDISKQNYVNAQTYQTINADLNAILTNKDLANARYGIAIFFFFLNDWVFTKNHKQLLVPASNTKLVTTFTNYDLLGENYQFTTSVRTNGKIENGILNGDIYIIGGGDPLLTVPDIEIIADEIQKLGIKTINGNIYGDGSFFDKITNRFLYSGDRDEVQATAPITALAIERNVVNVIVTSGATAGRPVNVQTKPASPAFTFSNSAVVSGANTKSKNITITTSMQADGKQIFNVRGSLAPNRTFSFRHFINNPTLVIAGVLRDRLVEGGITVKGEIGVLASETSQNTNLFSFKRDINGAIQIANKQSDNYISEMLFKLNGAIAKIDDNTAKSASNTMMQTLENNSISTVGFMFNDGSGLSRRNLITAEALVNILLQSRNKTFGEHFKSSLSIAGVDGTLAKRMQKSFAQNNLRAKTGTLRNVSSLAGLVETRSGDTLYFAYIFNGGGGFKSIENQISTKIAEY
jgi:PBP4 family serine-type D-alanyl-D-alanine carboxypeptidase